MATHKSNNRNPQHHQPNQQGEPPIEISDDSASEPGTPRPTLHPRTTGTRRRRERSTSLAIREEAPVHSRNSSAISDDLAWLSDSGVIEANSPPPRKRVKASHRPQTRAPDASEGGASPEVVFVRATERLAQPPGDAAGASKREAQPLLASATPTPKPPPEAKKPYYRDPTLEIWMFCGPGYEKFPVALGTIDDHKKICTDWDAMEKAKAENALLGLPPSSQQQMPDNSTAPAEQDVDRILSEILKVLPQIDHDFARTKIRECLVAIGLPFTHHLNKQEAAGHILSRILEADSYPQRSEKRSKRGADPAPDGTGVTIAWDRNIPKNGAYLKDAVILVASHFPYVPTHYIHRVVREKLSVFDAYRHIHDIESRYFSIAARPYNRSRLPRVTLEKKYSTRAQWEQRNANMFAHMVNELQAARQHVAREGLKLERQKAKEEAEAANVEAHRARGELIECKCCFDDEIPMNRAAPCQGDEIHFFCFSCVNQLAESQIGLMKYKMQCMDGSGCKAPLSMRLVSQAIPTKTFDRLAFNQQQDEIAAAGIEGLEQCPFCDFKGICDPVEEDPNFHCQNPDCFRATCRICKTDAHSGKTCDAAKADRGLSARHLVEEARTEALVRACPRCKVKIIKEAGCNKMVCTKCNCLICYVCKADITHTRGGPYEHFNRQGSKCCLYDKVTTPIHDQDADAAEEEAIKRAKEADASLDESTLRIETGKTKQKKDPDPQRRPPVMDQAHRNVVRMNRPRYMIPDDALAHFHQQLMALEMHQLQHQQRRRQQEEPLLPLNDAIARWRAGQNQNLQQQQQQQPQQPQQPQQQQQQPQQQPQPQQQQEEQEPQIRRQWARYRPAVLDPHIREMLAMDTPPPAPTFLHWTAGRRGRNNGGSSNTNNNSENNIAGARPDPNRSLLARPPPTARHPPPPPPPARPPPPAAAAAPPARRRPQVDIPVYHFGGGAAAAGAPAAPAPAPAPVPSPGRAPAPAPGPGQHAAPNATAAQQQQQQHQQHQQQQRRRRQENVPAPPPPMWWLDWQKTV